MPEEISEAGEERSETSDGARRLVATLLGLAVATVGGLIAVPAFLGSGVRRPLQTQETSAENGAIVYVGIGSPRETGANWDLFAVDPNTGHRWNLTQTPDFAEREPIWSPGGTRVVFFRASVESQSSSELTPPEGLYVMNADGGDVRELRPCGPMNCTFDELTWSADGSRIAFVDFLSDSVHVIDADTGHDVDLCTSKPRWRTCGQNISHPRWSPDGRWIAYDENGTFYGTPEPPSSIMIAAVDGSGVRRLTGEGCHRDEQECFEDLWPEWSLDGKEIAFIRDPADRLSFLAGPKPPEVEPAVDIADVATGRLRLSATCGDACSNPWENRGPWAWPVKDRNAISVGHPGREPKEVRTCADDGCMEPTGAVVSPDGTHVAFVTREGDLFAVAIDGGAMRRLADNAVWSLEWLPRTSPQTTAGIVPWVDEPPEPYPQATTAPATPSIPFCGADQVAAQYRGTGAATGHVIATLGIANASSTECAVQGMPVVRLVTTDGETLSLRQTGGVFYPDEGRQRVALQPGVLLPADAAEDLRPGQALLAFEWMACPPQPMIAEILLSPSEGDGTITIPLSSGGIGTSGAPMCEQGQTVEPWLALGNFQSVQPPPEFPAYTKLTATIKSPPVAFAGQRLRYEVTLRNPTPEEIRFDFCPSYMEEIGPPTGVKRPIKVTGSYRLNCTAAPSIEARGSVTFEMILDIPAATPPTEALLWWDLEPSLEQATNPVPITIRTD